MGFLKFATAVVNPAHVSGRKWAAIRSAGTTLMGAANTRIARETGKVPGNLVDQATGIFGVPFNPKDYLLTHATIVASVDTYSPEGTKTGAVMEGGFRVNRRYPKYRVASTCQKFINNNNDAWSRPVLLRSFETFIGGHNFVEHVQIEDLSKGRIIDAVARDIGDSVYIDILIATDRKHKELVAAIENGKMGTLSMGCTVDGTICTKCGHWAADETEMCPHIKYEKGNTFYDEQGRVHIVAELCGHESLDPTGGVQFIEASWVETPAFTGAVLRNVLEPTEGISRRAEQILNSPPPQWSDTASVKAASFAYSRGDILADEWGEEEEQGEEQEAPEEKSPLQDVEDELTRHLYDRARKRIKRDLEDGDGVPGDSTAPNDTMQHEGSSRVVYQESLRALARTASSDAELVNSVAMFNNRLGVNLPVRVYRASLKVGSLKRYKNAAKYLEACRAALGRQPTPDEVRVLARLSHLLSRRVDRPGNSARSEI
jgi:hypothetical protein